MPAAWVGPGCREKRVNFRRDRWLHGPDSESPTGKAGRHSRSTVAGLGEKRRLFFLYSHAEVMLREGEQVSEQELIAFVKESLGSYKSPKSIVIVDQLPLTVVGKVLRKDVRKKYWENSDRAVG